MERTALLSVSDKTGLVPFAQRLHEAGIELVASGGTAKVLRDAGLDVIDVETLTGFPHLLDGRVKTLHPAIHAGILARRDDAHLGELEQRNLRTIDVVVCNLYPFTETIAKPVDFATAIEQIDIGGVTLLRAAAKNASHVHVVCDPSDYEGAFRDISSDSPQSRVRFAAKAFAHTASYDAAIATWFSEQVEASTEPALPKRLSITAEQSLVCRYGENPHQQAALYTLEGHPLPFEKLQGKALSYNNLVDLDGAWASIDPFEEPVVAIVKHTNPCGLAVGETLVDAFHKARASDPISAFGSIIAVNRTVDNDLLDAIGKLFVEVLAAPDFTEEALARLAKRKKNCRAVRIDLNATHHLQVRSIRGALVAQTPDIQDDDPSTWTCSTEVKPTDAQLLDLQFAWRAAKATKSNAIVIATGGATVGVGAGQMNRLESVRIAARLAGDKAPGAVLASDAFFPFADGLEAAAVSGVSAVVQPGGSIRDQEVIDAANRLGISMVFTGVRHFKH